MASNALSQRQEHRQHLRAVATNAVLHLHPTKVPSNALRLSYTWGLGGMSVTLVLVMALTGILLMFRYEPTVGRAYASIQALETEVPFGSLFRALHHWSANLLVITAGLHLLRVLFTGGYKNGRAFNWFIGFALLLLVLAFNFTGYLLPWDQLSYWGITVSTSLLAYVPVIGTSMRQILLVGHEVGQGALSNFYALHVAMLPAIFVAVLFYHFWRVRKDGGISQPRAEDKKAIRYVTTIPHLVRREFGLAMVVITAVTLFAMVVPAPLGQLANPLNSPNPAKTSWYFLGLQELLLHMHAQAALLLVTIIGLGAILLPRLDRHSQDAGVYFRSKIGRRAVMLGALLAVDIVPIAVILDEYWLDLPGWLPNWPAILTSGLLPLAITLVAFVLVYLLLRLLISHQGKRANHSEALLGLYTFLIVCLLTLTLVGIYFRGPNMMLQLPV